MGNYKKQIQAKLTKELLDMIMLQYLNREPMHGYQIITKLREDFGVYFASSTVYPLLATMEKRGYLKSNWNMNFGKPRKVYAPTREGAIALSVIEVSLNLICKTMTKECQIQIDMERERPLMEQQLSKRNTI
jgi:PadR family transcriptional regulator PadR